MGKSKNSDSHSNMGKSSSSHRNSSSGFDVSLRKEIEPNNSKNYKLVAYLDALSDKRGSTREKALSQLVCAFERNIQRHFVDKNCITLQSQLMNSFKRGSTIEISLASRALGLLAITAGSSDSAHELMEESIQHVSQALKSLSEISKKLHVLNCLAVITFVGANDCEETQRSMQIIWQLIHPKLGSNVFPAKKPTSTVLAEAISAWSFLLTTIDEWRINSNDWRESISFFSSLLDKEDRAVRIAASEAIALIYEIGCLDKFCGETKSFIDSSEMVEEFPNVEFTYVGLKQKIITQVRNLSMEVGDKDISKTYLSNRWDFFRNVLDFFETGVCCEISMKIHRDDNPLKISTWAQLIQLNFLKCFLGSCFLKHMQENELLHDLFDIIPKEKDPSGNDNYLSGCKMIDVRAERESIKQMSSSNKKRALKSLNSTVGKARAQVLNEQRMLAQQSNDGNFAASLTNEDA